MNTNCSPISALALACPTFHTALSPGPCLPRTACLPAQPHPCWLLDLLFSGRLLVPPIALLCWSRHRPAEDVCPHQSRAPAATKTQRSDEPFGSKQPIGSIALVLTFAQGPLSLCRLVILQAGSLAAHLRSLIPPFSNISRVCWISNQSDRFQGNKVKSLPSPTKVTRL